MSDTIFSPSFAPFLTETDVPVMGIGAPEDGIVRTMAFAPALDAFPEARTMAALPPTGNVFRAYTPPAPGSFDPFTAAMTGAIPSFFSYREGSLGNLGGSIPPEIIPGSGGGDGGGSNEYVPPFTFTPNLPGVTNIGTPGTGTAGAGGGTLTFNPNSNFAPGVMPSTGNFLQDLSNFYNTPGVLGALSSIAGGPASILSTLFGTALSQATGDTPRITTLLGALADLARDSRLTAEQRAAAQQTARDLEAEARRAAEARQGITTETLPAPTQPAPAEPSQPAQPSQPGGLDTLPAAPAQPALPAAPATPPALPSLPAVPATPPAQPAPAPSPAPAQPAAAPSAPPAGPAGEGGGGQADTGLAGLPSAPPETAPSQPAPPSEAPASTPGATAATGQPDSTADLGALADLANAQASAPGPQTSTASPAQTGPVGSPGIEGPSQTGTAPSGAPAQDAATPGIGGGLADIGDLGSLADVANAQASQPSEAGRSSEPASQQGALGSLSAQEASGFVDTKGPGGSFATPGSVGGPERGSQPSAEQGVAANLANDPVGLLDQAVNTAYDLTMALNSARVSAQQAGLPVAEELEAQYQEAFRGFEALAQQLSRTAPDLFDAFASRNLQDPTQIQEEPVQSVIEVTTARQVTPQEVVAEAMLDAARARSALGAIEQARQALTTSPLSNITEELEGDELSTTPAFGLEDVPTVPDVVAVDQEYGLDTPGGLAGLGTPSAAEAQANAVAANIDADYGPGGVFGGVPGVESGMLGGGTWGGGDWGSGGGDGGMSAADAAQADANAAAANADADSQPGGANDGGGGGGGDSKIVCTAMNAAYGFGSYRNKIWLAYAAKNLTKAHEVGYHTIFQPLVEVAYHTDRWYSKPLKNALEHIARHRSADLRAEMRNSKRDTLGRIYRAVLEPVCYLVGKVRGH